MVVFGESKLNKRIKSIIVDEIAAGFSQIERSGKLQHGNGLFDFGDFQIHI